MIPQGFRIIQPTPQPTPAPANDPYDLYGQYGAPSQPRQHLTPATRAAMASMVSAATTPPVSPPARLNGSPDAALRARLAQTQVDANAIAVELEAMEANYEQMAARHGHGDAAVRAQREAIWYHRNRYSAYVAQMAMDRNRLASFA